jgi:hypothetical protein
VYGVAVSQKRNDAVITPEMMANVVTAEKITDDAVRDLVIASIAVKYVVRTPRTGPDPAVMLAKYAASCAIVWLLCVR